MHGNHLMLPTGTLPPLRGDIRDDSTQFHAAGPGSSTLTVLDPRPSTSMALVKHDEEIAKVTNQAYLELSRLSQVAAMASAAATSHTTSRPLQGRASRTPPSSNMFIKSKPKKQSTKKTDLEAALDRNRNLLKSREVCRLLSASQLEKLKSDTIELEKALQDKKERLHDQGLEQVMMGLKVEDGDSKIASNGLTPQPARYTTRGKAKLISAQENAKLQRANFEAEQEMQRTREYEMMGRQMGKMDLVSNASRYTKPSTNERDDDVDVLGLGPGLQDIEESDMGIQESDDW